jgi:hypothetical protein
VWRLTLSGDKIVAGAFSGAIRVINISTCLLVLRYGFYIFVMSFDTVEMIKQFPERISCSSLSFHGDVVYIASNRCVVQWNVVTDTIVPLKGYPGFTLPPLNSTQPDTFFR